MPETCRTCHGKGNIKCPKCGGKGRTFGFMGGETPCKHCEGSGEVKCGVCHGKGKIY
jgi:DnaJ-class molecular chaperone